MEAIRLAKPGAAGSERCTILGLNVFEANLDGLRQRQARTIGRLEAAQYRTRALIRVASMWPNNHRHGELRGAAAAEWNSVAAPGTVLR
jgi:hypothetical protein